MSTAWTSRYAQRTKGIKSSAIRELLKITQRPEVISFAGGLPAPDSGCPPQRSRGGGRAAEMEDHSPGTAPKEHPPGDRG